MAGRPRLRRVLGVWANGLPVGQWSIGGSGGHSLAYQREWIESPQGRPLSLSLPFGAAQRPLRGVRVAAFFDHLLPADGAARHRLQVLAGAASTDSFDLLSVLGGDCAGAVQLLPEGSGPGGAHRIDGTPLAERELVALCDALAAEAGSAPPAGVRLPAVALGGARTKTALLRHADRWCLPQGDTPSTHIFKLPLGARPGGAPAFNTSLENEWLCVRLLAAFGFDVPAQRIETFGAHKVLVVERTDRRCIDGRWWARLPTEDLCQATGTPQRRTSASASGPGLPRLLELLRGSDVAGSDRERLLAATVVLWLLAVPSLSAKRFALRLLPAGHFVMAPLWGAMSAWPVVGRQPAASSLRRLRLDLSPRGVPMAHGEVDGRAWLDLARRCSLGAGFASVLQGLARWAEQAIERVSAELPPAFPDSVSGPILEGVRRTARRLITA